MRSCKAVLWLSNSKNLFIKLAYEVVALFLLTSSLPIILLLLGSSNEKTSYCHNYQQGIINQNRYTVIKIMKIPSTLFIAILALTVLETKAFSIPQHLKEFVGVSKKSTTTARSDSLFLPTRRVYSLTSNLSMAAVDNQNDGVVELVEEEEDKSMAAPAESTSTNSAAPFLSQGEFDKEALELTNDPKQTRVIIYIIISLIPVLFLIPLMLGSRDLIPLDALPPVEMS